VRFVEACARTGLPTRVIRHGSLDRHLVVPLAIEQHLCIGIPLVHQMLRWQPILFRQGSMYDGDPMIVGPIFPVAHFLARISLAFSNNYHSPLVLTCLQTASL
jgi:hypothetical protein